MTPQDLMLLDDLLSDFVKDKNVHLACHVYAHKIQIEINRIWSLIEEEREPRDDHDDSNDL